MLGDVSDEEEEDGDDDDARTVFGNRREAERSELRRPIRRGCTCTTTTHRVSRDVFYLLPNRRQVSGERQTDRRRRPTLPDDSGTLGQPTDPTTDDAAAARNPNSRLAAHSVAEGFSISGKAEGCATGR